MSTSKSLIRPLIAFLCIALTALGLSNTYSDNTEQKALAEQTACTVEGCMAKLLSESRSAIGQSYGFQTAVMKNGRATDSKVVQVECARAYIFLGDYSCKVAGSP
jgi:hypothetical protein